MARRSRPQDSVSALIGFEERLLAQQRAQKEQQQAQQSQQLQTVVLPPVEGAQSRDAVSRGTDSGRPSSVPRASIPHGSSRTIRNMEDGYGGNGFLFEQFVDNNNVGPLLRAEEPIKPSAGLSGAFDGKLWDIEQRLLLQDRTQRYFMQQLSLLERKMEDQVSRALNRLDRESDHRLQLEAGVRQASDNLLGVHSDLQQRLFVVEEALRNGEKLIYDTSESLRNNMTDMTDMKMETQALYKQQQAELSQLRQSIQQNLVAADQRMHREQGKTITSSSELTRLNESQFALERRVVEYTQSFESTLLDLNDRVGSVERNVTSVASHLEGRPLASADILEEMNSKLAELDVIVSSLKMQMVSQADSRNRLETATVRVDQNVQTALADLESELSRKLENHVNLFMNRLNDESAQRANLSADLRQILETKERTQQDRLTFEIEELARRLDSFDQAVRSEVTQRKSLYQEVKTFAETQINSLIRSIDSDEATKFESYSAFTERMEHSVNAVTKELTVYRKRFDETVSDLTEVIKTEIKSRIKVDNEMKNVVEQFSVDLQRDVLSVRNDLTRIRDQFMVLDQGKHSDCAGRADKLSRYVDEQVRKAVEMQQQKASSIESLLKQVIERVRKSELSSKDAFVDVAKKIIIMEAEHQNLKQSLEERSSDWQTLSKITADGSTEHERTLQLLDEELRRKIQQLQISTNNSIAALHTTVSNLTVSVQNQFGEYGSLIEFNVLNLKSVLREFESMLNRHGQAIELLQSKETEMRQEIESKLNRSLAQFVVQSVTSKVVQQSNIAALAEEVTARTNELFQMLQTLDVCKLSVDSWMQHNQKAGVESSQTKEVINSVVNQVAAVTEGLEGYRTDLEEFATQADQKYVHAAESTSHSTSIVEQQFESRWRQLSEELKSTTATVASIQAGVESKIDDIRQKLEDVYVRINSDLGFVPQDGATAASTTEDDSSQVQPSDSHELVAAEPPATEPLGDESADEPPRDL
eukprot:GILJ01006334.1.p1 GENE.GILJ01006334.1~~GILJ01006334.1.p1  ORF type:complete len:1012 (-),score=216.19 GILJ01006334.1:170-3133(-)